MKHLSKKLEDTKGITLIALVITIIVLLILAGVSLSGVFSERGIFKRSEGAGEKYNEAKARETLETILLADGQYEKRSNPEYNQDGFLNNLITTEIPGSRIIEGTDIAVIGEKYAYELDRSVPKIGRYLGEIKDLVWPEVQVTSGPTLTNNNKEATFTVKASVAKNVITRIELWLDGKKIEKYTKTYEGAEAKAEVTETFTVNRNGNYIIKAYADLMGSTQTTVEGIVPAITFSPNEDLTWKKTHQTEVIVEPTEETITEMKYAWIKDNNVNDPADNLFTGDCLNNRTVTGGDNTMTGTYYLWVMLKTGNATSKYVSGAFNFDNEGPTVELTSTPVSETSFKVSATASDAHSDVTEYEFYIDGEKKDPTTVENGKATYTWDGTGMVENVDCYVVASDKLGNKGTSNTEVARTKLHAWEFKTIISHATFNRTEVQSDGFAGQLSCRSCHTIFTG